MVVIDSPADPRMVFLTPGIGDLSLLEETHGPGDVVVVPGPGGVCRRLWFLVLVNMTTLMADEPAESPNFW